MKDSFVSIVDREGASRRVSPEEATAAYRSGSAGVPGARVAVRHPNGEVGTIDGSELQSFLANPRARLASQEELAAERHRMETGGGSALEAAGVGLAHGLLPFGIGQNLITAFSGGQVDSEEQRRILEESPAAGTAAEIGGAILPAILTGGESAVARGAAEGAALARGTVGAAEAANVARSAVGAADAANVARSAEAVLPEAGAIVSGAGEARAATLPTIAIENPGAVGRTDVALADTMAAAPEGPIGSSALRTSENTLELANPQYARTIPQEAMPSAEAAVIDASQEGRTAMDAFDSAQVARGRPVQEIAMPSAPEEMVASARQFSANEARRHSNVAGSWTSPAAEAEAVARTASIEAGVPVLGRQALAAEEAIASGDRVAFQRILAGALNPIGEAGNAVRGLGTSLAPRAGATALEGSLFGASNYVNQAYLHDEPLSAEGLVMAMGEGAILGAVGELGVSGMTALARRGSQAVASRLSPSFREAMSEGNLAQYFADHAAVRATGANYSDLQKVRNRLTRNAAGDLVAGGEHNVLEAGGVLNRAGVMDGAPSLNVISERLGKLVPERGRALRESINVATRERGPQPIAHTLRERNAISQELRNSELASNRALADRFDAEFEQLGPTRTPAGMHDLRMELDGKIHWDHASKSEFDGAYRRMRNAVRQDLEAAMDAVSPEAGSAFRNANREYGYLAWAQRAAARAAAREGAVANMPLPALLSGGAVGAILGGVSVKALATGFVTGAIHQWVKRHGAAIAASGLSALAKSEALNRAAAAINQNAGRSVRALFSGETLRRGALYGATRATNRGRITERQYQSTATNLYRLAHDPEAVLAAGSALTPVMQTAPGVGLLAQQIQAARLSYLASLVPGAADPNPLSALLAIRGATEKEKQRFSEALAVGKDPSVFMQSFAAGEVTPQQVADMRAMWPSTYQTMANQIEQELAKPNPVSPEALRTVRIFMGGQVVSETREYLSLMQSSYGTPGSSGPGTPAPGQSSTMTGPQVGAIEQSGIATRSLTSQQAAEQRIASGGPGSS